MTDKDIKRYNAVVIGGGASGLMCACRLAYDGVMGIAVLERNQKAGKKLLMTGNGRCNLTNDDLDIDSYNTDDREILTSILKRYGVSFVKDFFEGELGVMLVSKGSLIYPRTLKSVTVCEALERYLRDRGVDIITDTRVNEIKEGFLIDGEISSSNIIIACGGASYPKTGSDGSGLKLLAPFVSTSHMEKIYPSLVQFNVREEDIRNLSGIRVNGRADLIVDRRIVASEEGEMLFTDYGVSGICIMQLSGIFNRLRMKGIRSAQISFDMFPDMEEEALRAEIERRNVKTSEDMSGMVLREVAEVVLSRRGDIARNLKSFTMTLTGTRGLDSAQVTGGGLKLSCVDENLMLKEFPGLYVIGETLNVDGPCGGYNLQWAWSSAMACADAIASESP